MSVIKPLHAGWLVALYDYLTGAEGRRCVLKGWEKVTLIRQKVSACEIAKIK